MLTTVLLNDISQYCNDVLIKDASFVAIDMLADQ